MHQAHPGQLGQVRARCVGVASGVAEEVHRHLLCQVPQQGGQGFHKHALAVPARPVQQEEHLLGGAAGETVSCGPLQVADHVGVVGHDAGQEPLPQRAGGARVIGHRSHPGEIVFPTVRAQLSSAQAQGAVLDVQHPRIRV